jgi:hypothetical protein
VASTSYNQWNLEERCLINFNINLSNFGAVGYKFGVKWERGENDQFER